MKFESRTLPKEISTAELETWEKKWQFRKLSISIFLGLVTFSAVHKTTFLYEN